VFITAKQFNQKPRIWVAAMCRLAARNVPPGGSSSRTQKPVQNEVSPVIHHPLGDFWKNSRNAKIT